MRLLLKDKKLIRWTSNEDKRLIEGLRTHGKNYKNIRRRPYYSPSPSTHTKTSRKPKTLTRASNTPPLLSGPGGDYITGQPLIIDGGLSL